LGDLLEHETDHLVSSEHGLNPQKWSAHRAPLDLWVDVGGSGFAITSVDGVVKAVNDLDVLLRHRPRSIPRRVRAVGAISRRQAPSRIADLGGGTVAGGAMKPLAHAGCRGSGAYPAHGIGEPFVAHGPP
jgi:hypothetical protein